MHSNLNVWYVYEVLSIFRYKNKQLWTLVDNGWSNRLGCRRVTVSHPFLFFFFFSKTHQSGGEMLLSHNSQQSPTRLHPRAQVHPVTKLPLPSDVSVVFSAGFSEWHPHKHIELHVFHPGLKNIRQVSSLLDISHHQSPRGDRPEKRVVHACVHTRPSVTRFHTHAQRESRLYHRLTYASPGSAPFEYDWMWKGRGNWMHFCFQQESKNCGFCNWTCFSFACHTVFPSSYCVNLFLQLVWSEFNVMFNVEIEKKNW